MPPLRGKIHVWPPTSTNKGLDAAALKSRPWPLAFGKCHAVSYGNYYRLGTSLNLVRWPVFFKKVRKSKREDIFQINYYIGLIDYKESYCIKKSNLNKRVVA